MAGSLPVLMVIFGAGASYGSRRASSEDQRLADAAGHPWLPRPPVTAGLFAEHFGAYAAKYPSSRPAIVRLRQALRDRPASPIEEEIGRLYESASNDPERARHLMALRFYLADLIQSETRKWWELFHGFTLYADLLELLGAWRSRSGEAVVLVTFNYDELLDRSAEAQVGDWSLTTFASHVDRDDWRLYKLHGSTAWRREVPTTSERADPTSLIAQANEIMVSRGHLRMAASGEREELGRRRARLGDVAGPAAQLPGIAVPTNLKQTFECPEDHLERFTAEICNVDRLLTIGWRGAEPHAVELLAKHLRPGYELGICDMAAGDVRAVHANLRPAGHKGRGPHAFIGGFEGLLGSDDLERWLALPIL